jgi:hypothetical protein
MWPDPEARCDIEPEVYNSTTVARKQIWLRIVFTKKLSELRVIQRPLLTLIQESCVNARLRKPNMMERNNAFVDRPVYTGHKTHSVRQCSSPLGSCRYCTRNVICDDSILTRGPVFAYETKQLLPNLQLKMETK